MVIEFHEAAEKQLPFMRKFRRDMHSYPETAWTEVRTASRVAAELASLGFEVKAGKEVIDSSERPGLPGNEYLEECYQRALKEGADPVYAPLLKGGFTGIVADIGTGDYVRAFRFDMDALTICESLEKSHLPASERFRSSHEGIMHACGHDFHTAAGLGFARMIALMKDDLPCRVRLIFQPAEEGVGGAVAMVNAGVMEGIDELYGFPVLPRLTAHTVMPSLTGFSAATKIAVTFKGREAHAGRDPEKGANALLAACHAVIGLQSLPRHSGGRTRVNTGMLQAGKSSNIIPGEAEMRLEVRGETDAINEKMYQDAVRVLDGAAAMCGCAADIKVTGRAGVCINDPGLAERLENAVKKQGPRALINEREMDFGASEDFSLLMKDVAARGGRSLYWGMGVSRGVNTGLHSPRFDVEEDCLVTAAAVMASALFSPMDKKG